MLEKNERQSSDEPYRFPNRTELFDEGEQAFFNAELTRSELEYLRYQIKLLDELAAAQLQEIRDSKTDLELMHKELQQMSTEKQLTFDEAIELANTLIAKRKPIREVLAQLISEIYGRAVILKKPERNSIFNDSSSIQPTLLFSAQEHSAVTNSPPPFTKLQLLGLPRNNRS